MSRGEERSVGNTLRLTHEVDHSVTVRDRNHTVLVYRYDHSVRYPYCHPVNVPDGPAVTLCRPFDHDWHLGMYFAWKYVNGFNVWEGPDGGEAFGLSQHRALSVKTDETAGAGIAHALTWTTAAHEPLLDDYRVVLVRQPRSVDYYCIDWAFQFEPRVDTVVLERKPEWGGYAGLSVRFPRSFSHNRVLNAEHQTTSAETYRARSAWTDYSGWVDGRGPNTWAGVAMLDHPANARFPTAWLTYDAPDLQFLNAALLRDEAMVMRAGHPLRLAYRVLVHWGAGNRETIEQQFIAFAATDLFADWHRLFPAFGLPLATTASSTGDTTNAAKRHSHP